MAIFDFFRKKETKQSESILLPRANSGQNYFDETAFLNGRAAYSDIVEKILGGGELSRQTSIRLSKYLYRTNEFAQGMIDRYIGKVINNGLMLEACPNENILSKFGINSESITEAIFDIEAFFSVWKDNAEIVSQRKRWTFGELQRVAMREALIKGDCLIVSSVGTDGFPRIDIIGGDRIKSPKYSPNIIDGIELDENGAEVKYFVENGKGGFQEISAYGKNTNRRVAWLLRANDTTSESLRGEPFVSVIIRTLHELNESLASEQAAMRINSQVVLTHKRGKEQSKFDNDTGEKLEVLNRWRKSQVEPKSEPLTNSNQISISEPKKGFILTGMENSEEIDSFDTKRPNLDVPAFIIESLKSACRAKGFPPEVFLMEYNTSYSASTNARNDFYELQKLEASRFISNFLMPIYREILLGMVARGILEMPKYAPAIESGDWLIAGAWEQAQWSGSVEKPIDLKLIKALEIAESLEFITPVEACKKYFGNNFYNNLRINKALREKYGFVLPNGRISAEEIALLTENEDSGLKGNKTKFTEDGNLI